MNTLAAQENGQKILDIMKKNLSISSHFKISKTFYVDLIKVLKQKKKLFSIKTKKRNFKKKLIIGNKIKKICKRFKVKFLINDDVYLTKKLNADGCHLGQKDMKITEARKLIGNKIVGITCHNSIKLAKISLKDNPDYLAFGAFSSSKRKK